MKRTAFLCGLFVAQKGLLWVGVITLVALAAACSGVDPQSVNPASPSMSTAASGASTTAAVKSPKTVPRDLSGELDGTFTFEMYSPYGETDFIARGEAKGTLSHLGLSKMYTAHQPNPIGDGTLLNTAFRIVAFTALQN